VGFAIPSDTITRELPFLITAGKYDRHPYLGVRGTDMNYLLAQAMGINITYGVLIERVAPGGPAEKAGLKVGQRTVTIGQDQYQVGGDVIVSMNGVRIVNFDAFAAYIEEHLTPGDTVQVGIIRSGAFTVVEVTVAARPSQ
jgi:S1-C subfamily serine protease